MFNVITLRYQVYSEIKLLNLILLKLKIIEGPTKILTMLVERGY